MSLTPDFSPDAKSQWLALSPRHQEHVLDEIARLCVDPPPKVDHVSTLVDHEGELEHVVFVHAVVVKQMLTLLGVGHVVKRIDQR